MIRLTLELEVDGTIRSVRACGHARKRNGVSLACGVVSALLRSFGRWVLAQPGLELGGRIDGPGDMELDIGLRAGADRAGLHAAGQLVLQALRDIAAEDPADIELEIVEAQEENNHGS